MLATRRRTLKGLGVALAALAAGLLAGGLLSQASLAGFSGDENLRNSAGSGADRETRPGLAKSRLRPSAPDEGSLTFSRRQWSMYVRRPSAFSVGIQDCLPVNGESLTWDHPATSRLMMGDPPPRLYYHAQLFGWDARVKIQVYQALMEFGQQLAAMESDAVKVEYPQPGTIRFDFSRSDRMTAAMGLLSKLKALLGEKDSERFINMVHLEGLSYPFLDYHEITVRMEGDALHIMTPGSPDHVVQRNAEGRFSLVDPAVHGRFDSRVIHLSAEVDWNWLNPEAGRDEQ